MRMLSICLCTLSATFLAASAQEQQPPAATELTAGQRLYARHCAACHGEQGDGKGLAANWLYPKPRIFRGGKYRLVSTDNNVPTRDDLNGVLLRGMPGSSMPSWAHLSQDDRNLLIDEVQRQSAEGAAERYVQKLKEQDQLTDEEIKDPEIQSEIKAFAQQRTKPGNPIEVPPLAEPDAASIARGKALYTRQSCHSCHGVEGKGDGVQRMIDDEGFVMRPRDLTRGIYKGGHDARSLFIRLRSGMPGTPMPASNNLQPQEIVDLVHFLRSLSTEEQREAPILKRGKIVAARVAALPADSDERSWRVAAPVDVCMTPLWWRDDAVPSVRVQAMHDGQSLVFRLAWADPAANTHSGQTQVFKDAAALELFAGDNEPFLGMGSADTPIDLWVWDADRATPGGDLEDVNPRVVVDVYPLSEKVAASAEYARPGTKTQQQPGLVLPAQAVGNLVSRSTAHPSAGSSLTAAGPGSATFRIKKSQLVTATGRWSQGKWTVLIRRPLSVGKDDGISLAPGQTASIALAVWDGSHGDRNGQKQVSIWQDLVLEAAR